MASLEKKSTIGLLLGLPGSGKSWLMTRYLLEEWIPDHEGKFITNLPLNLDKIVKYCEKFHGMTEEETRDRIMLVPQHIHEAWVAGEAAPDSWFQGLWHEYCDLHDIDPDDEEAYAEMHPLCGALIVLDETMEFCPAKPPPNQKETVTGLLKYLTVARHSGSRLIFCTQDQDLVHEGLVRLCGFQIHLTNLGDSRIPWLGIRVDTVFQFLAKTRWLPYLQWVHEQEFLVKARRRTLDRESRWILWPWVFQFYTSTSKDKGKQGKEELPAYLRFGWWRFLGWCFKQNWFALTKCGLFLLLLGLLVWPGQGFFYGWRWAMKELPKHLIPKVSEMAPNGQPKASEKEGTRQAGQPERLEELIEQNQNWQKLNKELTISLADAVAERERLEKELQESSQITLMNGSGVMLTNGDWVDVGGAISAGPYRGRIIEAVNVRSRRAVLDDGTELRLRQPRSLGPDSVPVVAERQRPQPTPAAPPVVQGSLPGVASNPDSEGWYSIRGTGQPQQSGRADRAGVLQPVNQR